MEYCNKITMDIPYGSAESHAFVSNVGLITSDGPNGPDIMSAEWTHHVSYKPGLIEVCVAPHHATHKNIAESKEFGVNIASSDQNAIASIAGESTGTEIDKIKALEELGFTLYQGKKIKARMVQGAILNVECRLVKQVDIGDHTLFIGEALDVSLNPAKTPLVYHKGKYWLFGENIAKPPDEELLRIKEALKKHRKQ